MHFSNQNTRELNLFYNCDCVLGNVEMNAYLLFSVRVRAKIENEPSAFLEYRFCGAFLHVGDPVNSPHATGCIYRIWLVISVCSLSAGIVQSRIIL